MAHYAKVVNGIVVQVIKADDWFIRRLPDADSWVQTSYNTHGGVHYDPKTGLPDNKKPLRKNYAGKGYSYDKDMDAFIPKQPFPSWTLNKDTCLWEPPVPRPYGQKQFVWDEQQGEWIEDTYTYLDSTDENEK